MHAAKYTKVEPRYKNYHIGVYFKTNTVVAYATKCWTQCGSPLLKKKTTTHLGQFRESTGK